MTTSMTAFARVQEQFEGASFSWELKSVNHRYLELSFRLPELFRHLESTCRNQLKGSIHRGKLDCTLKLTEQSSCNQLLSLDEQLINSLLDSADKLAQEKHLANDLGVSQVLSWPGVIRIEPGDIQSLSRAVEANFEKALSQLVAMRLEEGSQLLEAISTRLETLTGLVHQAKQEALQICPNARDKLLSRFKTLSLDVSDSRVEQELALLIARLDVSEELDRLCMHIDAVRNALNSADAAGRRLDFLMQELHREANTLSAKSDSARLTQLAVEMKVVIEQMREQVQNIE